MSSTISTGLSAIVTQPLTAAVARLSQAALDPNQGLLGGFKSLAATPTGGALLAGGAGFIGGSALAQLTGGNAQFGGLGGGIGAAGGFALGNFLAPGVGGIPGAALGGLLGSIGGGLFGSEKNLGNDRSAQAYRAGRGITYSDRSFSEANRQITSSILGEIEALEEAFIGLGGVVGDVKLRVEAGNKTGIVVNGKKYDTAEDALRASIEKLIGGTTGLSATQQTILATTKGGTAAEIGQDLAFGERYDELTYQGTQFELALRNLGRTFEQDARKATELGLDVTALAAARDREAVEIARQADQAARAVTEQIAAARGDTGIGTQLHVLETQMRDLAAAAAELGIPLEQVALAHQEAAAKLIAANSQIQRNIAEQLAALTGDRSLQTQLHVLETQIRDLAIAAANAGIPLSEVTRAHQLAAKELIRAYSQQQRGVFEQIAAARGDQSLAIQLHALDTQMRDLAKAATEVGIPLSQVTKAHVAAANELKRVFAQQQRGVFEQILAARGDQSLGAQLHVLETQMRDLAKAATDVGIPLREVTKAHQLAAKELLRAFSQQQRGVFEQIAAAGGDQSLPIQLHVLDTQMRDLAKAAADVGLPLSLVAAAHRKAADAIREEFEARKRVLLAQVDELGQFGRPLDRALGELQSQVEQLARELIAAGLPIDQLVEAHRRAAEQIVADWEESLRDMRRQQRDMGQSIVEAQRSAQGAVDQFLAPIKEALSSRGIGQGVYAGAALTERGVAEFRATLEEARTGDTEALAALVGTAQAAISQARETYGSTAAFARIFEEVERGLREQQGVLEQKRDQLLEDIGTVGRETVDEIIKLRVQAIGDLRQDFARLSRDLIVAVEGRA